MNARNIVSDTQTASCYFRTSVVHPYRKALVQITERCNLTCAHCFVSAGPYGDTMPLEEIRTKVVPRLSDSRVTRVTLTGGEPFVHPDQPDHHPRYPFFRPFEYDFYRWLGEAGYRDAFRLLHPTATEYSWVGRTGDGYRYDHAFVSGALAGEVTVCAYVHESRTQTRLTDHSGCLCNSRCLAHNRC